MAHPVDEHVGKPLKERRVKLGLSQEALAQYSGITFQQVQKYERGTNRISASRIFEFANVLKVPVNYFFDHYIGEGALQLAEEQAGFEVHLPDDSAELAKAYDRIEDPEVKKSVRALVLAIADGSALI